MAIEMKTSGWHLPACGHRDSLQAEWCLQVHVDREDTELSL